MSAGVRVDPSYPFLSCKQVLCLVVLGETLCFVVTLISVGGSHVSYDLIVMSSRPGEAIDPTVLIFKCLSFETVHPCLSYFISSKKWNSKLIIGI